MLTISALVSVAACVPSPSENTRQIGADSNSDSDNSGETNGDHVASVFEPIVNLDLGSTRSQTVPSDPNALRFSTHVRPLLDRYCTECHHAGKGLDFTRAPSAGALVDRMLMVAQVSMPPLPRDRMEANDLDVIRTWKAQGMLP